MSHLLELEDVRAGYGRIEILHGLNLVVPPGTVVALLGPNGVGKTTALRTIAGLVPTTSGSIRFDGRRIDNRRPNEIAKRGLVLIPEGRGIFPALTVEENLRIAHRSVSSLDTPPWAAWLEDILKTFPPLAGRLAIRAGLLSGGEQQMLALGRALAGDPKALMFDELSMGLAPIVVQQLFDQVAALRAAGRTIVLVEQYLTQALKLADVCFVLAKGEVVFAGEPAELRNTRVAASYLSGG